MGLSAADKMRLRRIGGMPEKPSEPRYMPREEPEGVSADNSPVIMPEPLNEPQDAPEDVPPVPAASEGAVMEPAAEGSVLDAGGSDTKEDKADFSAGLPEEEPAGIRYRREPGAQPRPIPVRSGSKEVKPLSLRVPASLVDMCKRSSGDTAVANSNAVAAFLYAFRDKTYDGVIDYSDVSDGVIAFSRTFDTAKERAEFNKRVAGIDRMVRQISDSQMQLLWTMLYLVWDAAGFRTDHPDDPSEIGFGQSPEGFEAMMKVLDEAVREHVEWTRHKNGRPIR